MLLVKLTVADVDRTIIFYFSMSSISMEVALGFLFNSIEFSRIEEQRGKRQKVRERQDKKSDWEKKEKKGQRERSRK